MKNGLRVVLTVMSHTTNEQKNHSSGEINDESSPEQINTLKSWPSSWQDGSRRSAFQLYRPTTVLTNLQRGNIQARAQDYNPADDTWFEKAGRGDLNIEEIQHISDINLTDENGLTALMWSAAYGHTTTVLRLINAGADVNQKGRRKQSALHLACGSGHHNVVKGLLSHGAKVNDSDICGNSPLMYAVHGNHIHTINELLQAGADISQKNFSKQWPYQLAIESNHSQAQVVLETHMLSQLLSSL